ncbi:PAS domain S-box protein [Mucilaginibacter robiniae]|uniref:histidine kinase n=1 Tax=Mucilaginibacter robiniae TaxID=2728022 RepID=A0A7L5DWC5_9SPHI|nr:PAS domain-containing sensor histidine kinase [Mucilaginibacter robiniae]QJD94548.1 PAS domain S-box protein [Mucilaginibacter robiniae]
MNHSNARFSDRQLLEILALSKDATAIYSSEDITIEMANDAMLGLWGKDRSIIGLNLADAVPALKDQPFLGFLKEVWRTGITYEAKESSATLQINGQLQTSYFDFVYRAIKNNNGETCCILHTATDVTELVLSRTAREKTATENRLLNEQLTTTNQELSAVNEELTATNEELLTLSNQVLLAQDELQKLYDKLLESEERFRAIFDQAPLGMCLLRGREQVIELANENILKIWGRRYEEVIDFPQSVARPELGNQPILQWLDETFTSGTTRINTEIGIKLYDQGTLRDAYINSVYQPIKDNHGTVTSILVILEDVTQRVEQKKREERIQEMFNMAVQSANLGTWYIDAETREFVPSLRLKELFGYYPDEIMPYDVAITQITDEYRDLVIKAVENSINKGESYDLEYPILGYHDNQLRWVRATGKVYQPEDGKHAHFSGTILDITERKLDDIRKNDFIAIVSHELKTPLTSAKAYIQVLSAKAKKVQDNFTAATLDKVDAQINKMNTLIKGFLDVARLESGKIHLATQTFNLQDLLKEVVDESILYTNSHQFTYTPCQPINITGDREKILQVINNLLSNAVKYSPQGKAIEISCTIENGMAKVWVKDEGMGVKPEDQAKLFDRFYRVETKHTQTISGFGIGLYLCAEIIKRHHGNIGVESNADTGSTFWFTLPITAE